MITPPPFFWRFFRRYKKNRKNINISHFCACVYLFLLFLLCPEVAVVRGGGVEDFLDGLLLEGVLADGGLEVGDDAPLQRSSAEALFHGPAAYQPAQHYKLFSSKSKCELAIINIYAIRRVLRSIITLKHY